MLSIDTSFNGQSLWRETYTLDAGGNRTARADTVLGLSPANSTSYGYDGLLRLTSLVRTLTQTGTPLSSESLTLEEVGIPFHAPMRHAGRTFEDMHVNLGPVRHIRLVE